MSLLLHFAAIMHTGGGDDNAVGCADSSRAVLYKLVTFAILMAVVPIGTYFASLKSLWPGAYFGLG